jgi:hypothetical protein
MLGLGGVQPLIPVCPSQFKDVADRAVFMADVVMYQSKTDPDPELITMVAGCVHDNQYATLIKAGRKGAVLNDLM